MARFSSKWMHAVCRLERQVRATLATEKRALLGSRAAVARWRAALAAGTPLQRLYAS